VIVSRYGILGITVIRFFCEGKKVGGIVGYVSAPVLKSRFTDVVEIHTII
jgi:hypothetical protein